MICLKKNYQTVIDIQWVLKIWKIRNLVLEGKIVIFETIAISKIVFQEFITTVPKHCEWAWKKSNSLLYEKTLCIR